MVHLDGSGQRFSSDVHQGLQIGQGLAHTNAVQIRCTSAGSRPRLGVLAGSQGSPTIALPSVHARVKRNACVTNLGAQIAILDHPHQDHLFKCRRVSS
jgi:hypothetical protein